MEAEGGDEFDVASAEETVVGEVFKDLNISRFERLEVVKSIQTEDYSEGPIVDDLNNFKEMWVFGKDVNGCEVYIKVAMGEPNNRTLCISFHKAEHKMAYPFKQ